MIKYIHRPRFEKPFIEMLETTAEPRILNLHSKGIGGMGKSLLLQRYQEICREEGILCTEILDFRATEKRSPRDVTELIAGLDTSKDGPFASYRLSRGTFDEIRRAPWERPERHYRDIEEQMDRSLVEGLDQLLALQKVVILLDSWERVEGTDVEEWVSNALFRNRYAPLQNRHNLLLVIAGRNPLSEGEAWKGIPIQKLEVGPFTLDETRAYAESRGYRDDPVAARERPVSQIVTNVHHASGGHPVIVAWAFDYGDLGIRIDQIAMECRDDKEAFGRRLVEETPFEEYLVLGWAACLYRRFDVSILKYITQWPERECKAKINESLKKFPSILRRGEMPDSCELHDEARDMLIRFGWKKMIDPKGEEWHRLRKQAIEYYTREIERLQMDSIVNPSVIPLLYAYMAERLFYCLDLCEDEGCFKKVFFGEEFWKTFDQAMESYQIGLARSLTQEVARFQERLPAELQNWLDIARARILSRQGKLDEAMRLYEGILSKPNLDKRTIAQIKSGIGRCHYLATRYDEALKAYGESLSLRKEIGLQEKVADTISYMAMVYRAKGEWERAKEKYMQSFREALKLSGGEGQKRAAIAADQAAQVALMMGDATMTRSLAMQALKIWETIGDEYGRAFTLTTLGRVEEFSVNYDLARERQEEAIEIYSKGPTPNEFGQHRASIFLGRVYRRQGQLKEAEDLVEGGLDYFKKIGRKEYIAFALCELGCVYREQKEWEKAEKCFEESIKIADEISDTYRQTVVYEDLCVLSRKRGDPPEKVLQYLEKVEEIASKWGYELFLGRVEKHRGDLAFEAKDYENAFDHYVRAAHHLAKYNTEFYIRFLPYLEERLYDRPLEEMPRYCDRILMYWRKNNLDKVHTALVERCERAKEMAQMLMQEGESK